MPTPSPSADFRDLGSPAGWSAGVTALELLAGARAALEADPPSARRHLDRLAELFGGAPLPSAVDEALLIPALPPRGAAARGGLAPWQLRRVLDQIERSLAGPLAVAELAETARLSSGHFCRAFKASVGEAPHAFLIRRRIRRAQFLMLSGDETLSQIACACGLADQAHLTKLFRKLVGETPLAWRRSRRRG